MSPILVRPVREQFEHDRVIRVLQAKYKRKYEVAINPGAEQNASVGVGDLTMYPDLVLFSQERVRKIQGTVEVETTESVNTLEAMAEWAPFSRLRTPDARIMRAILSSLFEPGGQVSPILVRPVREQFEHDRVIRVLQAKYKRKYEVAINPGAEQNASVGIGELTMYPDLVLFSQERTRKIHGTVEVETTESINTLEAMAEWGPFSRLRTPFYLYVPANSIDTVRRLCSEHAIDPAEIWTYHTAMDQLRFTMVHRSPDAPKGSIAEHKPKIAVIAKAPVEMPAEPASPSSAHVAAPAKSSSAQSAKTGKTPQAAQTANASKSAKPSKAAAPAKAAKKPASVKPVKSAPAKSAPAKSVKSGRSAKSGSTKSTSAKSAKSAKSSTKKRR